jgi:hypothetical protein
MKRLRQPGIRHAAGLALALLTAGTAAAQEMKSPRELYNQGVQQLAKNQLREAEGSLRMAVQGNQASVQPVALYNLGHVRFAQGQETLKGEGNRQMLLDSGTAASALAEEVIRRIGPVTESEDVNTLVGAYMDARAARKRIRLSRDESTRELDLLGSAISRWHRSLGDFLSANELDASNVDAKFNADVVDRRIEELLKFKKKVEQQQDSLGEQKEKLREMMKKMRGKIPKERQRESDDEESDEDDDEPQEPQGQKEQKETKADKGQQKQRIGGEREIDPDVLKVLKEKMTPKTMQLGQDVETGPEGQDKEGFRPVDGNQPNQPKTRRGRDW